MSGMMSCLPLFILLYLTSHPVPVHAQLYPIPGEEHLYPYGPAAGDIALPIRDDSSSGQIFLTTPIIFFGVTQQHMWINHNGIITFGSQYTSYRTVSFPLTNGNPSVAPWWTDINIADGDSVPGTAIYYRQSTDPAILARATCDVQGTFGAELPGFQATWVLIATWHQVTFYGYRGTNPSGTPINTFQAVFVSDGTNSMVLLHYGRMDWTTGTTGQGNSMTGLGGTAANVGFDAGNGADFFNLEGSQTADILDVAMGSFHYRIDTASIADIQPLVCDPDATIPPDIVTTVVPTEPVTEELIDPISTTITTTTLIPGVDPCEASPCSENCICISTSDVFQCQDGAGDIVQPDQSCVVMERQAQYNTLYKHCHWCWVIPVVCILLLLTVPCCIFALCIRKKAKKEDKETLQSTEGWTETTFQVLA